MLYISLVSLLVSLSVLGYCLKLTIVYHRFNEQIKTWAESLDDQMMDSINLAARKILTELDARITDNNNLNSEDNEDQKTMAQEEHAE